MSAAGILPVMNGSAFELGKYDLEEGEISSDEPPAMLTDDNLNNLLGRLPIFGKSKEGLREIFNEVSPCQSSSLSKGILRDKRIPVAPTLNVSRERNTTFTLDRKGEKKNSPKGSRGDEPVPVVPGANVSRQRNREFTCDSLREKNGPKDLQKDKPVQAAPGVNISRGTNSACTSDGLKEKKNTSKGLLKDKHLGGALVINVSGERNSSFTSNELKEKKKNGPKVLVRDKLAPVAPALNVSRERNCTLASDRSRGKKNGLKGLVRDNPVSAAPTVNVSRERKFRISSDGLSQKKIGTEGLVRDEPVPVAPTVNISRKTDSSFTSDGLRKKKNGPKVLRRDKPMPVAPTVNISRERNSSFTSDGLKANNNRPQVLLRDKPMPVVPTVNVPRERNISCTSGDPKPLKIRIKIRPSFPKDVHQILKEFELPLEPMLSPLPESLLYFKESDCQPGKRLESNEWDASMNQKKINPSPKESKIIKLKISKDKAAKVSEGKADETLTLISCRDKSLSADELEKKPTDETDNSTVRGHAISDNWVCCDRCQKWRLMPFDANPNLLPKKWICSMLNWLPGMNKCSFTEDETTEALHALLKMDQNRDLKEESVIKIRSLKRKCQLIMDDDDADEHLERKINKVLKPCSVEGENNVESKLQISPVASDFLGYSGGDQILPDQMISDGKKRKMSFEAVDQNNLGNGKKAKIAKKSNKISFLLKAVSASPRGNLISEVAETEPSPSIKRGSSQENCKPTVDSISRSLVRGKAQFVSDSSDEREKGFSHINEETLEKVEHPKMDSILDRYGKLRRMILKRKTQRDKSFSLINERNLKLVVGQNTPRNEVETYPFIKECGNQSLISALNEAKKLKNHAERMKAEGLERECTSMSFDAALKFLQVASLLEPEVTKNGYFSGATDHAISMYSDAAKLCGICAEEYEKYGEMGAAALAYKCMEVAYMRIVFIKHSTASTCQGKLKRSPCVIPTDDSPSSSDVENATSQCNYNVSCDHQTIISVLNTVRDMDLAMEASKKAYFAYNHHGHDNISSLKKVLDASFHDIDGLLLLARISVDAITHPSSSHH